MGCVTWKPSRYKYYAFYDEHRYDRQERKGKTRSVYLGADPAKAAAKLRQVVQDEAEYSRLVKQLWERRPAGRPPQDEAARAVKALSRLTERFRDERVKAAIAAAIERLKEGQ
ncbi:hypothetical protein [Thermodesulfitimonas autotrophica]|uniref:hypothetical protein n=1 Tax=Thermodesulfitimonas autotrophica TaxID=1894989 RepID=UPI002FE23BC7